MRLIAVLSLASAACAAARPVRPPDVVRLEPRAKVLLVGTFHFDDAGLDAYKPKYRFETMSPQRQKEIAAVVEALAKFRPTKIALEFDSEFQPKADQRYAEYLAGRYELKANEIYQIGFRLGRMAGVKKLYGIDVKGRRYEPEVDLLQYAKEHGQMALADEPFEARYKQLYEYDDALKTRLSLRALLLYANSPERVRLGHGVYLTREFHVGAGDEYPGTDSLTGWWYNRNLRIYENIHRLIESPNDRIVVLIGAGHLPILKQALESAPDVELVALKDVL